MMLELDCLNDVGVNCLNDVGMKLIGFRSLEVMKIKLVLVSGPQQQRTTTTLFSVGPTFAGSGVHKRPAFM